MRRKLAERLQDLGAFARLSRDDGRDPASLTQANHADIGDCSTLLGSQIWHRGYGVGCEVLETCRLPLTL
jgi:hypothetical protein